MKVLSLTLLLAASGWGSSKVVWPYLEVPHIENPLGMESHLAYLYPKYTTVFGIPIFGGEKVTVRYDGWIFILELLTPCVG